MFSSRNKKKNKIFELSSIPHLSGALANSIIFLFGTYNVKYSQTCLNGSTMGHTKTGCLRGDPLIQVHLHCNLVQGTPEWWLLKAGDPLTGLPWSGKNIWKMNVFQVKEKSGNFVDGQGNLETTWNVSEKSGNLKVNGYGRQTLGNLIFLFKGGKDVLSHEIV